MKFGMCLPLCLSQKSSLLLLHCTSGEGWLGIGSRSSPQGLSRLSHYVLLLERSPTYFSLYHKKERGKVQWRVSRLATIYGVRTVCRRQPGCRGVLCKHRRIAAEVDCGLLQGPHSIRPHSLSLTLFIKTMSLQGTGVPTQDLSLADPELHEASLPNVCYT